MKRSEVTVEALKRMGYKAMVEFISWNSHTWKECNPRQSAELFDLVVNAVRKGGQVQIRRLHLRGCVVVNIDGVYHRDRGSSWNYFLQRPMTEAEIMEESMNAGVWVTIQ